jgi:hypothetical protein
MGDEQGGNDRGGNVERGTECSGWDAEPLALVNRKEEVGGSPEVEHPRERNARGGAGPKSNGRDDREDAGYQVAVTGGNRKGRRQRLRNHTRYQEAEPDEPKEQVRRDQEQERVPPLYGQESGPDVELSHDRRAD